MRQIRVQRCLVCGKGHLHEQVANETFLFETNARSISVTAAKVPVEVCDACGESFRGPLAALIRNRAIAEALGLLTAKEIRMVRKQWGMSLSRFARLTGIDRDLLSDWEMGKLLPSRALDNYLRLLQDPSARAIFERRVLAKAAQGSKSRQ